MIINVPKCPLCGKDMKTMDLINNETRITIWICRSKKHPLPVTNLDWRLLKSTQEDVEWEKGV